jgi:hypothetical protein
VLAVVARLSGIVRLGTGVAGTFQSKGNEWSGIVKWCTYTAVAVTHFLN